MIKFKIDEQSYTIPDYISIENYSKIFKIKDLFKEDYFAAKLVSIITGAPMDVLLDSEYQEIAYLAHSIISILPNEENEYFFDRFEIDGIHYGFFPNWRDLTFAEFVDMDTISTKKPEQLLDMLHILAAIMYRPIVNETSKHNFEIEKYDVESMKKRAEIFKKKLDVNYVIGAQFFFIKFAKKCLEPSLQSSMTKLSMWETIKLIWMMWRMVFKATSNKRMVGSQWSTELRKMILQNTR